MKPDTPKTATHAMLRWQGGRSSQRWFGGRPYDWEARASRLVAAGVTDLEVSFLTRQGWGPYRKVTP